MTDRQHFENKIENSRYSTAKQLFSGEYVLIIKSWIEEIPSGKVGMFKVRTIAGKYLTLDESRLTDFVM